MRNILIIAAFLFFSSSFFNCAFSGLYQDYLTVKSSSITVKDVTPESTSKPADPTLSEAAEPTFDLVGGLDSAIMVVDKLIALGDKVWKIVEAGKPVVNIDHTPSVSVLPLPDANSLFSFYEMEGWQYPKIKEITIVFKNMLGFEVVRLNFVASFQYGGSYNDKGHYLTGINIYAGTISVSWGYSLDANVFLDTITNHGTKLNPIAGATMGVSYTIKTAFKQQTSTYKIHVTGEGDLQVLNH